MTIGIDSSVLLSFYQARTGGSAAASGLSTGLPAKQYAPTAPWSSPPNAAQQSAAVKAAMAGRGFIDENAAKLDLAGGREVPVPPSVDEHADWSDG